MDSSFINASLSDGSYEKPFVDLLTCLKESARLNDGTILLASGKTLKNIDEDVEVNINTTIMSSDLQIFTMIEMGKGVIIIRGEVIFQKVIFNRQKIDFNSIALEVLLNGSLKFIVSFLNFFSCFIFKRTANFKILKKIQN